MMKILFLLFLSTIFFMSPAFSQCASGIANTITNTPFQGGNITIGPDTADGTIVYRQTSSSSWFSTIGVGCTAAGPHQIIYEFLSTPLSRSAWNSGPYAGKVYETGVSGLGVVLSSNSVIIPATVKIGCSTKTCAYPPSLFVIDLSIIKTGPVTAGSINGTNLPCINLLMGQQGDMALGYPSMCFSGALNIVSQTCSTPNVKVEMGSYPVNRLATIGSATNWIDASINLINCPMFYGIYQNASVWSDGLGTLGAGKANSISLTLIPTTGITSEGYLNIENQNEMSATGVAIQLASGTSENPTLLNLNSQQGTTFNQVMTNNQGGSVSIPFAARYIKTAPLMTPGRADGKITFIINYY
ncbi:P pilus assembly protein%2C pilin FimA [Yersinia frederiksenii]|nr:P pilus assembly protein%2C pilin FimA [Yersinia frederiksenii]